MRPWTGKQSCRSIRVVEALLEVVLGSSRFVCGLPTATTFSPIFLVALHALLAVFTSLVRLTGDICPAKRSFWAGTGRKKTGVRGLAEVFRQHSEPGGGLFAAKSDEAAVAP